MHLVEHKAANRVGQRYAIDQQDREDGQEVQQRNHSTCTQAEMFFNHVSDI